MDEEGRCVKADKRLFLAGEFGEPSSDSAPTIELFRLRLAAAFEWLDAVESVSMGVLRSPIESWCAERRAENNVG